MPPLSEMSATSLWAATMVSLALWGVNVHPPTMPDSSCALAIVPLWATHRSRTLSGCALARLLLPIVEYRTWPIAAGAAYSDAMRRSSRAEPDTRPVRLRGSFPGTAIPHASWPRCCRARSASIAIGTTLKPDELYRPTTPQFSRACRPPSPPGWRGPAPAAGSLPLPPASAAPVMRPQSLRRPGSTTSTPRGPF